MGCGPSKMPKKKTASPPPGPPLPQGVFIREKPIIYEVTRGPPVKQNLAMGRASVRLSHTVRRSSEFSVWDAQKVWNKSGQKRAERKSTLSGFGSSSYRSSKRHSTRSGRSSMYGNDQVPENQNPAFFQKRGGKSPKDNVVDIDAIPVLPPVSGDLERFSCESMSSEPRRLSDLSNNGSFISSVPTNLPSPRIPTKVTFRGTVETLQTRSSACSSLRFGSVASCDKILVRPASKQPTLSSIPCSETVSSPPEEIKKPEKCPRTSFEAQLEAFQRKREELRRQRDVMFARHENSAKEFKAEASKIALKRQQTVEMCEDLDKRVKRKVSEIVSRKNSLKAQKLSQEEAERASLERFKEETSEVRGFMPGVGRYRTLSGKSRNGRKIRPTLTKKKKLGSKPRKITRSRLKPTAGRRKIRSRN